MFIVEVTVKIRQHENFVPPGTVETQPGLLQGSYEAVFPAKGASLRMVASDCAAQALGFIEDTAKACDRRAEGQPQVTKLVRG